jgi:hypothetical protein
MRRIILILLCMMMPAPAFSAAEKKAESIEELAQMYDVSSCKECHEKEYNEWKKSYHSASLVGSLRTMATIASAVRSGMIEEWEHSGVEKVEDLTVEHMMICLKCHLPQIQDATDKVAQEIAQAAIDGAQGDEDAVDKLRTLGINCIICHNKKALLHKWVDGEIEPDVIYGTLEGEHPDKRFPKMKKSPIIQESILCGQCHGLGPSFDLPNPSQCPTLYGSYLHAYVPAGGTKTCQECHIRKNDYGHYMPSYREPGVAKSAVDVEVITQGYYFLPRAGYRVPTAYVTVKMTNRAGHRIPDG